MDVWFYASGHVRYRCHGGLGMVARAEPAAAGQILGIMLQTKGTILSPTTLNFIAFSAACVILYWCGYWAIYFGRKWWTYIKEVDEMISEIWWHCEKEAQFRRTREAENLVTPDRPKVDIYPVLVRIEINRIISGLK